MNIEHQTSIKLIYMKPFIALYLLSLRKACLTPRRNTWLP